MPKYTLQLFPNSNIYKKQTTISDEQKSAICHIPVEQLSTSREEQQQALEIIENWIHHLSHVMHFIVDSQLINSQSLETQEILAFKQEFHDKSLSFITNPDHGIVHSFFVYRGIVYLSEQDGNPIQKSSIQDIHAQLFALLHDAMQDLPFSIAKNDQTKNCNQKNDHAKIMAELIYSSGTYFGFDTQTIEEFGFGILVHDSSYFNIHYAEKLNYLSKLGHDSDKLLGASYKTDPQSVTESMLKRNYEANRGPKGSYLLRTELDRNYRAKIVYGDRCLSDSVSLVKKEFTLKMYTKSGEKIAQERIKAALDQVRSVYGYFFDLTAKYLDEILIPNLEKINSQLLLSTVGMDQEEKPINISKLNKKTLENLVNKLYNTPIELKISEDDIKKFSDRYNLSTDARGLKIRVLDTQTNKDVYLDPSIARFYFLPNGREKFTHEITLAFTS